MNHLQALLSVAYRRIIYFIISSGFIVNLLNINRLSATIKFIKSCGTAGSYPYTSYQDNPFT